MKKISYIICLTAILCSCNNELPIENVQELQTPKSKEDSEILSFKNSEEFLSTIENFDLDNPILTRASSSFVMNEQQKIQYIAHTISPTILNSIITNVFSFFLNTCQRSTEYLSRAKGKKYRTSEASTGDFLPGE